MSERFSCGIITGDAEPTTDTLVTIWNPHASISIYVLEIWVFAIGLAGDDFQLYRATGRGLPGSTVTPGIENHFNRRFAPISGVVLDAAPYTANNPPIIAGPALANFRRNIQAGSGFAVQWEGGIEIPGGTGLSLLDAAIFLTPPAASDVLFVWEE